MAVKAESNTEKALAYIAKHPGARSPEIAEAIGIAVGSVSALLNIPVAEGFLVACKVERPGKPPINEYRLSAAVAEDKVSWAEFRLAKRANVPLTKAPDRPPRNASPAKAHPVKAEAAPAAPPSAPIPEAAVRYRGVPMKAIRDASGRVVKVPDPRPRGPIEIAPRVVFMVDSTGQLRIEIPDHPPIVCSREETRDAGRLMISTEPVWS